MNGKLTIENLVVVEFRSDAFDDSLFQWRNKSHVPFAESCARQIWYGTEKDFKNFPITKKKHLINTYNGREGYNQLLNLVLGLKSQKIGETNIKGQFFNGWSRLNNEHPHLAKKYDSFVQHITADTRLIRRHIMKDFQEQRYELVARDLSKMSKGARILIIGHLNKKSEVQGYTEGLARITGKHTTRNATEIAFTHSDCEALNKIQEKFIDLKLPTGNKPKIINSDITRISFDELSIAFELYDQIYVCMPMGHDVEADLTIIDCWKNRINESNMMVHLKGNTRENPVWGKLQDKNYISPEDVQSEFWNRMNNNENVIERAKIASSLCANLRLSNKQPSKADILKTRVAAPELLMN